MSPETAAERVIQQRCIRIQQTGTGDAHAAAFTRPGCGIDIDIDIPRLQYSQEFQVQEDLPYCRVVSEGIEPVRKPAS